MDGVASNAIAAMDVVAAPPGDASAGGPSGSASTAKGSDFNIIEKVELERQYGDTKAFGSEGMSAFDPVKRSVTSVSTPNIVRDDLPDVVIDVQDPIVPLYLLTTAAWVA